MRINPAAYPILSIRQPWADLIVYGEKDIENRTWKTNFRGRFYIHASLAVPSWHSLNCINDRYDIKATKHRDDFQYGGIIGVADIVDCVKEHKSKWFDDHHYAFVLKNATPVKFYPLKGKLGFFRVKDNE